MNHSEVSISRSPTTGWGPTLARLSRLNRALAPGIDDDGRDVNEFC